LLPETCLPSLFPSFDTQVLSPSEPKHLFTFPGLHVVYS
jgi:hypothetical protein